MASAQEYCNKCKQYGHRQNKCPWHNQQQFYPGMMGMHPGMHPGMMGMYHQEEQDEAQDFPVESYHAVPVELDENFWQVFCLP